MLVPLTINLMIWSGLLNSETVPPNFLNNLITQTSYVWVGSILAGIVSLFIKEKWRIALLICPLILPALFTVIYTITQG